MSNCWVFHSWTKWYPRNAVPHSKQTKKCKRCGAVIYREVGL